MPVAERSKVRDCGRWDFGFESLRQHGCLPLVGVVCCQVEVSATGRSLVQRSPTDCDVSFVSSRKLKNEAALDGVGLLRQRKRGKKILRNSHPISLLNIGIFSMSIQEYTTYKL
jgi:hypothetical protein